MPQRKFRNRAGSIIFFLVVDKFLLSASGSRPLAKSHGVLENVSEAARQGLFRQLHVTHILTTPLCDQGPNQSVWNASAKRYDQLSHGYGIWNHMRFEPLWGDLDRFRSSMKAHGLGVIYDLVHHARDPYAPIFTQHPTWAAPSQYNDPTWLLTLLDLDNPEVRDYFVQYARYWIQGSNDGGRLDSCHEMLEKFSGYPEILESLGDMWLFAELIEGDVERFCHYLNQVTAGTNYPLYFSLSQQLSHEHGSLAKVAHELHYVYETQGIQPWRLVNFVENHDMILYRSICQETFGLSVSETDRRFKVAYALCYLLPGIPKVYYSSLHGYLGNNKSEDRSGRPEFVLGENGNGEFFPWLAMLGDVRTRCPALIYGSYTELWRPGDSPIWSFCRSLEGETPIVIVVNNGNNNEQIGIPISAFGEETPLREILGQEHNLFVRDGMLMGWIQPGILAVTKA
jgi:Alpha amylase, catalytic domain